MATSEEYLQSILTNIQKIKRHPNFDQPAINDLLSEVDDKVDDVVEELEYLDDMEDD